MSDPSYLTTMARIWRNLAVHAGAPEAAFNLCALALMYDRQAEAAEGSKHRCRAATRQLTIVSSR